MSNEQDLFGNLDGTMDFLQTKSTVSKDGLYRVDMKKAKEGKWRSVVRFLPNFTKEQTIGPSAIEKITHYVAIKQIPELAGYYDSPKNFGDKCALSETFYSLKNSKNAILQENAKMLNYSRKYFSYVLVIEDQQQPDLVGKVMCYQYGVTIKDKISAEKSGEISGVPCNVFDLSAGKDFTLLVREIDTGDSTYPDYKGSQFQGNTSPIKIKNADGELKEVPLDATTGKVDGQYQGKIKEFLLARDHDLENFGPKKLTEEQQGRVSEVIN